MIYEPKIRCERVSIPHRKRLSSAQHFAFGRSCILLPEAFLGLSRDPQSRDSRTLRRELTWHAITDSRPQCSHSSKPDQQQTCGLRFVELSRSLSPALSVIEPLP